MTDTIEKKEKAQERLEKLLLNRSKPYEDFGVISMCCGSGRTPEKQHWPIKEFVNQKKELLSFRYKDTEVTYDVEKNNVEFVTFGPGTGRNAVTRLDAARGINPSIEEIMEQQKELYQALSKIRSDINKKNPEVKILPEATLIGFSRGAAAVQKMSGTLVQALPVYFHNENKEDDVQLIGKRIELTIKNGVCEYAVYNDQEKAIKGKISKEDLEKMNIKYDNNSVHDPLDEEQHVLLSQNINHFLWTKNQAGVGTDVLVDPDKTNWISLDAVAGRKDSSKENDHYFNNDYCKGLYVMSTRLAQEHALLGFGATDPQGDAMEKLFINGKHGEVFDTTELREVIIENTDRKKSLEDRQLAIKEKVEHHNKLLLNISIIGNQEDLGSSTFFKGNLLKDPEEIIKKTKKKLEEKGNFLNQVGEYLGLGAGTKRLEARYNAFSKKHKEIEDFLIEQNNIRKENGLPALENFANGHKAIESSLNELEQYSTEKKEATTNLQEIKKVIVDNLMSTLIKLKANITINSTINDISLRLKEAKSAVISAIDEHKDECKKTVSFYSLTSGEGKLGILLERLRDNIEKLEESANQNITSKFKDIKKRNNDINHGNTTLQDDDNNTKVRP